MGRRVKIPLGRGFIIPFEKVRYAMVRRVKIPWVGGSKYHGNGINISWVGVPIFYGSGVRYTMGRRFKIPLGRGLIIPSEKVRYTMGTGFIIPYERVGYNMVSRVKISWVGFLIYHGYGVKIPWVGISKYHGTGFLGDFGKPSNTTIDLSRRQH